MKKYLFILGFIAALCSCSKEGTEMYNPASHYLYIPQQDDNSNRIDTTFVTFQHHPDAESYDVYFDVYLAGLALDEDKTYNVEVVQDDAKSTTALPEEYQIATEQVFHAGLLKDQLKITIKKSARMDTETVKVTVRLVANENFALGDYLGVSNRKSITASVTYNNQISKPTWWNEDIETNYLGEWTATKYGYFIQSCNGEVLDLTDYEGYQIMELALNFKEMIEENDWRDEDGEPIELPIY